MSTLNLTLFLINPKISNNSKLSLFQCREIEFHYIKIHLWRKNVLCWENKKIDR